jgi:hypothetical protein
MATTNPKVGFKAFVEDGAVVGEFELSAHEWYEGSVPIIDSAAERLRQGIRRIEGEQTDESGKVYRTWKNTYDEAGQLEDLEDQWIDWKPKTFP